MLKRYSALDPNYLPGNYPLDEKISVMFQEIKNLNLQGRYIFLVQKAHYEKYDLENLLNLRNLLIGMLISKKLTTHTKRHF